MSSEDQWINGLNRPHRPRGAAMDVRGRHRCPRCRGQGQLPGMIKARGGKGMGSDWGPCPECGGEGWIGPDAEELDEP